LSKSKMGAALDYIDQIFNVDAKFTLFFIAGLVLIYMTAKIILKLADSLLGPVLIIFVGAFILSPEVNSYVKTFVAAQTDFMLKTFGIKK
jgi:hypothetical protein